MPFICKITGSDNIYHTVVDQDYLRKVWTGAKNSNFTCVGCGETVFWVDPQKRKQHVKHNEGSLCSLHSIKSTDAIAKHAWIQKELYELGQNLEQQVTIEHRDIENGFRGDVVWHPSKICWEVDLTTNSRYEQNRRKNTRQKAGLRMVSLVSARDLKRVMDHEILTIALNNLHKSHYHRYPLAALFVANFYSLNSNGAGMLKWQKFDGKQFDELVRECMQTKATYINFKGNSGINKPGWGWCPSNTIGCWNKYLELQRRFESKNKELNTVREDIENALDIKRQLVNDLCDLVITRRYLKRLVTAAKWKEYTHILHAFGIYIQQSKGNVARKNEVIRNLIYEIRQNAKGRLSYMVRKKLSRRYTMLIHQFPNVLNDCIALIKPELKGLILKINALFVTKRQLQQEREILIARVSQIQEMVSLRQAKTARFDLRGPVGADQKRCPKCSSVMVKRTAKKGKHVGKPFLGCSAFPKCRQIIQL